MLNQSTINKVILAGKIDKEPRWHVKNGKRTLNFSFVTTERIKRNGFDELFHEYHQIQANEQVIGKETLNYGTPLYIQGRLQTSPYTDDDAIKRYKTVVVAYSIEPLGF
ncbi:single-stranded DNA-binding protein [Mucilaginibacter endophyticus]|uniref:single-stranded DNA-binding protein n=1 Tax=Mucilaginibacter endophyticus TaxID=2675003 RepID=UPI000E0D987C|nr:single-stranded DNA-binding protein [Mucilaginibacter endophyticus]